MRCALTYVKSGPEMPDKASRGRMRPRFLCTWARLQCSGRAGRRPAGLPCRYAIPTASVARRTAPATSQATAHCMTTMATAPLVPTSLRTVAMVATQGV